MIKGPISISSGVEGTVDTENQQNSTNGQTAEQNSEQKEKPKVPVDIVGDNTVEEKVAEIIKEAKAKEFKGGVLAITRISRRKRYIEARIKSLRNELAKNDK